MAWSSESGCVGYHGGKPPHDLCFSSGCCLEKKKGRVGVWGEMEEDHHAAGCDGPSRKHGREGSGQILETVRSGVRVRCGLDATSLSFSPAAQQAAAGRAVCHPRLCASRAPARPPESPLRSLTKLRSRSQQGRTSVRSFQKGRTDSQASSGWRQSDCPCSRQSWWPSSPKQATELRSLCSWTPVTPENV